MNRDSRIVEIEIEKIVPNRFQPRKTFNDDISELAESIRAHGVLQPITVRPLGEKFEIVMGERRYRACEKLGMHKIPCMIVEMNDRESMEVALIENLQRQNLSPIEEALSYKRILEAGYITQDQLAQKLGKTQSTIANKLRLLSLDREIQSALLEGSISERHARSLLRLENKEQQKKLLRRIIDEKLTVKKTDEEIKKMEIENYEKPKEEQSIEIIDFDDNPFRDPIPVPDFKDEIFEKSINNDYNEPKLEVDLKKESRNQKQKFNIPNMGIIDDFEKDETIPTMKTNHSFSSIIDDEEKVELNDIEPDLIDFDEIPQNKNELFDDMVKNVNIQKDFNQIKPIIEKCQSDLKALGYKVEFEKIDLETMYQVIFKINKN